MTTLEERLAAIAARADAATAGPWEFEIVVSGYDRTAVVIAPPWSDGFTGNNVIADFESFGSNRTEEEQEADIRFIAHSREDVPWLVSTCRALVGFVGHLGDCHLDLDGLCFCLAENCPGCSCGLSKLLEAGDD